MSDGLQQLLRGAVANEVLGAVIRDVTRRVRVEGGPVPEWAQGVCEALAVASGEAADSVSSVFGTHSESVELLDRLEVVALAADLAGVSDEYVRRLCRSGRVRSRRIGNQWLVDMESLTGVLQKSRRAA